MSLGFKALPAFLLLVAAGVHAEELGRLFFTPQQRALLERGQVPDAPGTPDETGKPASPDTLTIDGIVQRHGGERTVWINGVPQPAGKSDEHAPETVPVAIPGQTQPARVKVGQKVLLNPSVPPKAEEPASPAPGGD